MDFSAENWKALERALPLLYGELVEIEGSLHHGYWCKPHQIDSNTFICWSCGKNVTSNLGLAFRGGEHASSRQIGGAYVCTGCECVTMVGPWRSGNFPSAPYGSEIDHLPDDLQALWREARKSYSAHAYTGAVLICRKILMHVGVENGAKEGKTFVHYVEHLADTGYIPPNGKGWVDYIRESSNEANHEIIIVEKESAEHVLLLAEMLLTFVYKMGSVTPPTPNAPVKVESGGGAAPPTV